MRKINRVAVCKHCGNGKKELVNGYELEEVMEMFEGTSITKKVAILHDALSIMQHYNGRSENEVIAEAMGYTLVSDGDDELWVKEEE